MSEHRSQQSLLAPIERVCLAWLARHTPSRVHSDHLTLLGFGAMLAAGLTYAAARWWTPALLAVNLWIAVNWLGDSLDGTLARVRNKQRPRYGFYVDHMVDAFGSLFLIAGLAFSGFMSGWVALGLLLGYLLLSIDAYLATYALGTFHLSFWKFSPTEMRILLAVGNAVAFFRPYALGGRFLFFDVAGAIAIFSMAVVLVVSVARNTRALYLAERV
jgi:phosphatidylglycerophosphate synthase